MNHLEVSIISSLLIESMHRPRLQFVYARGAALIDNMFWCKNKAYLIPAAHTLSLPDCPKVDPPLYQS